LPVPDISNHGNVEINNTMLLLSKFHNDSFYEYYGISKAKFDYIFYKIKERDENGRWTLSIEEYARIPIDDELTGYYSSGNSSYLQFARSGLRRFSLVNRYKEIEPKHSKLRKLAPKKQVSEEDIVFQEDIEFKNKFSNLTFSRKIIDFDLGFTAGQPTLYFVTGGSKIYRVMPDGSPDYIIEVK